MTTPLVWNESDDVEDITPGYDRIGGRTYRSVDVNHNKIGHLCSTLCGASMTVDFDLRAERGISPDDVDAEDQR